MDKQIQIKAYGKINLTLEVLGRRDDGYHELRSIMMPVALFDELKIDEAENLTSNTGYEDDLCLKAARVLSETMGVTKGAKIEVEKHIPVGAGLGGGSADAAATLVALNDLWGCDLMLPKLLEIAAMVGSDVPGILLSRYCGPVLMEGRGERVLPLFSPDVKCPPLDIRLKHPGIFCSTPEVYSHCKPRNGVADDFSHFDLVMEGLESGDVEVIARGLINDLEAPAINLHPEIEKAKEELIKEGAVAAMMTGSGSTVFGLFK